MNLTGYDRWNSGGRVPVACKSIFLLPEVRSYTIWVDKHRTDPRQICFQFLQIQIRQPVIILQDCFIFQQYFGSGHDLKIHVSATTPNIFMCIIIDLSISKIKPVWGGETLKYYFDEWCLGHGVEDSSRPMYSHLKIW